MVREKKVHQVGEESVIQYLLSSELLNEDVTLNVLFKEQKGQLHIRDRSIYAAHYGGLQGNGAAMIMASWHGAVIEESPLATSIKKNISLNPEIIQKIQSQTGSTATSIICDEDNFRRAILLIYSLDFKNAGAKLTEILRTNRYHYKAWLWYSRLLGKTSAIESALNEAQKWGSSDQDIWNELKKIQPFIQSNTENLKRCHFCWSPLDSGKGACPNCKATQSIQQQPNVEELSEIEVKRALHRYHKTFQKNPKNPRLAYILSLGMYNLEQFKRACYYQEFAVKAAPDVPFYSQVLQNLKLKFKNAELLNEKARKQESFAVKSGQQQATVATSKKSTDQKTILVVEDSQTSRKVISMVLKREGLKTIEATTGEEALELAKNNSPDLVLLDVMLPDMTGHDVLPEMRKMAHLSETPIIMLTGRKGSEDRMKGLNAGVSEYLTKPFDPQKLTTLIRNYL